MGKPSPSNVIVPLTRFQRESFVAKKRNRGGTSGTVPSGATKVTSSLRASAEIQIDARRRSPVYEGQGKRDVMIRAFIVGGYTTGNRRKGSFRPATDYQIAFDRMRDRWRRL